MSFDAARVLASPLFLLCCGQLDGEGRHDLSRDVVLQGEDVVGGPVVPFGPDVAGAPGIGELGVDAEPVNDNGTLYGIN